MSFDPSAIAVKNGSFMGLDVSAEEAKILLLFLPWDVTTSYRAGTVLGPQSILNASYQLDFITPYLSNAWDISLGTLPSPEHLFALSQKLRPTAEQYIGFLSDGGDVKDNAKMRKILDEINNASDVFNTWSYEQCKKALSQNKKVISIGGEHSVSYGPIKAYSEKYKQLSILHFDAHADLRVAYEGFEHSHASIMHNVLKLPNIEKLVQVGLRDLSPQEIECIQKDPRIFAFFDWTLQSSRFAGETWDSCCDRIVSELGKHVYISFDIDGLDPKLCPNTGTPVPGGLEFYEATRLIEKVKESGREIVGADIVEVAPALEKENELPNEWDANVGARLTFQICSIIASQNKQ